MPEVTASTPAADSADLAPGPAEDPAGSGPLYTERLTPGPGTWVVVVIAGAVLGVLLVPVSLTAALVTGIIGIIAACIAAWLTSPVIEVDADQLRLGRARIPVSLLGAPQALPRAQWDKVMSTGFEPLAFHCTRGWIHTGLRVPVLDPADPTPAWVASSRAPEDLALAITAAQAGRPRS
ncbi:DUF3093 domain-containing protein [Brachybacterium sp. JHP9]|uniref:DUF3093 domain-containing protein n=1 Tax=Brachybacterium equifaecis TaxID=2910770 RepID=A0ABT0R0L2_9MICO|nr:DUF3093 domain-containing protein [Brachybacterium equifaecis]MCL6423451.1 DUF3093 domain-containing protein [Brachybacterium equifaecis]